jgi:hypothetical protein
MSLLWVAVIVLTVLVLLLYRQFGLAYMSGRTRAGLQGLDLGARARPVALTALDGTARDIDWSSAPVLGAPVLGAPLPGSPVPGSPVPGSPVPGSPVPGATAPRATVLVFAQPSCPICGELAADAASLPASWPASRFVWVDGTITGRPPRAVDGAPGWIVGTAEGDAVHKAWDVSGSPFAYVVGANGRIAAKGVVNRAADIERLLANVLGQGASASAGPAAGRMIEIVPDGNSGPAGMISA